MIRRELLDLAFDARLRRIFDDEDRGAPQDLRLQLRLARAIAADGVDVDPRAPTMLSLRMVAFALSAVTVVMMSAPSTAASAEGHSVMSKP